MTTDASRTDWISAEIMPDLPGEYEVRNEPGFPRLGNMKIIGNRRYWDGNEWCPYRGSNYPTIFGRHPSHQWRGLTEKAYKLVTGT